MKKLFLIVLSVSFLAATSWAADVVSVPSKETGNSATYQDFNAIVDTVKGFFNKKFDNGKHNLGINTPASNDASLKMKGLVRLKPFGTSARPICTQNLSGSIYADALNGHLWGCNGSEPWVQLDTDCSLPVPVNGSCDESSNNGCGAGLLDDIADSQTEYLWNCLGTSGGSDDTCSLLIPVPNDGRCGSSHGKWFVATPEFGFCADGAVSSIDTNIASYRWGCLSEDGGADAVCTAFRGSEYTCMSNGSWQKGGYCLGPDYEAGAVYLEDETICYVSTGTARCEPISYTGTWNTITPPSCTTSCGSDGYISYGSVVCSNGDCDPTTKPNPLSTYCPATASCASK